MATKFQKGETVRLDKTVPQGPVVKLRMDEEGNFFYLVEWTDADGDNQVSLVCRERACSCLVNV
jgi:hypothetical protein